MNPNALLIPPAALWLAATFVTAFFVMAIVGKPMIAKLKSLKGMKWSAREDTPDTHAAKAGTPSMGGLGILFSATMACIGIICTMMLAPEHLGAAGGMSGIIGSDVMGSEPSVSQFVSPLHWLLALTLAHMALGLADDWSKATGRGGLRARAKLAGQLGLAAAFLILVYVLARNFFPVPSFFETNGDLRFDAANPIALLAVFAFLMIVIVGTCNAVNITDGIDGLAAGLCVQVGFAFWLAGNTGTYDHKQWVDLWWLALAGACAGFLIYNRYRAQVFMGDTGSLALGAALGAAAVLTRTVFLLPFIGFMFFVELLSVTAQVAYFKYTKAQTGTGQRIFKRAPLHHHFELSGWSEKKVVAVFWSVNLVATAIGLILWRAGVLPRFP